MTDIISAEAALVIYRRRFSRWQTSESCVIKRGGKDDEDFAISCGRSVCSLDDRATVLQALGVLDGNGKPAARLDLVKAGKVARLTKEAFRKEREKMTAGGAKCHGASYAKKQLDEADAVVNEMDKIMAEAIRVVQELY